MLCLTFLPPNISIHILHTVLYTFLMVLTRRICLTISLHILHTVLHTFLMVLIRRIRPTIKNSSGIILFILMTLMFDSGVIL